MNKLSIILLRIAIVAIFSILYVLGTGCKTPKAPIDLKYTFKDTITGTVTSPSINTVFTLNCDSFQRLYDSLLKVNSPLLDTGGFVPIFDDSNATVLGKKNTNGSTTFKTQTKPKEIPFSKPIERTITVPCNCPDVCPKSRMERLHDARFFLLTAFFIGFSLALYIKIGK